MNNSIIKQCASFNSSQGEVLRSLSVRRPSLCPSIYTLCIQQLPHKVPLNLNAMQLHYITGHYLLSARKQKQLYVFDSLLHHSHLKSVELQLYFLYEQYNAEYIQYITYHHQGSTLVYGLSTIVNAI